MTREEMIAACYATPQKVPAWMKQAPMADYPVNLLPTDPDLRAHAAALAQHVSDDMHSREEAMKLTSIGSVLKKAFPIDGSKPQGLPAPARLAPFVLDESIVPALLRVAREDDVWTEATEADERAIIEGIRRRRLWSTGDQMEMDRVVASIGDRVFDFSWRGWGALLSRAWCGTDEHYTVFAWGSRPGMEAPPDVVRVPERWPAP